MASEGSLLQMEKAGVIDDAKVSETQDLNYLCKVTIEQIEVWRVLCLNCRNSFAGYKRISLSLLECDRCGCKPATSLNWQR